MMMKAFPRRLERETLDDLAEDDPRAKRARRDLQRLNRIIGSAGIIANALVPSQRTPTRIIELGTGDGSLMLRLAQRLSSIWPNVQLTLLDRQNLIDAETRENFQRLGWPAQVLCTDVMDWAAQWTEHATHAHWDIGIANLFIHHFDLPQIRLLFAALAHRTDMFIACEPRRACLPLFASRLVGLISANEVTREDAVLSTRAGFDDNELSLTWPSTAKGWQLEERPARLFSHLFIAMRRLDEHGNGL